MGEVTHIEVAWETDPLTRPADEDWTRLGTVDPSLKIESLNTSRGVNIRTGDIETGQATATIGDQNGNLDPSNALSEWSPNVLPRRRIRFVVDPAPLKPALLRWDDDVLAWEGEPLEWSFDDPGETVLWTGFVNTLPIQWRREVQWTTLTASGIFWLLADTALPPSVLHGETINSGPVAYWPMSESSGRSLEDVVGVLDASSTIEASASEMLLYASGGQEFRATSEQEQQERAVTVEGFTTSTTETISFWFRCLHRYPSTGDQYLQKIWRHYSADDGVYTVLSVNSIDGTLTVEVADGSGNSRADQTSSIDLLDGHTHHVVVVVDSATDTLGVWVDAAPEWLTNLSLIGAFPDPSTSAPLALGFVPSLGDYGTAPFDWVFGHAAVWDRALDLSEIASLYSAGIDAWAGDLTGARLNRVLDLAGVDADDRDIDAGTQTCGPTTLGGANVMEYVRKIAATEGGPVGEDSEGRIFLRNKIGNAPASVATFSDDPDGDGGSPVAPLDPQFSLDRVINIARVTRENGTTQEVTATASTAAFGPKTVELDTLHQSPSGSRSAASRLTIRNHDPRLVFPSVQSDSIDTPADVMTGTDIGDAVVVIARPPRGGDPIEQTSIVERVEHALQAKQSWRSTFGVVEHTVLPDFWWDEPGQGWDESVWVAP